MLSDEKAVYQLQTIKVNGKRYSIFFDSGCGDFVTRQEAVINLGLRAVQERPGPIKLGGVGGISTESTHGIYTVKLPLFTGQNVHLSGVCLDEITGDFPENPFKRQVEDDIKNAYEDAGGDIDNLPQLPSYVGGEVDFLLGIKYLRYHPEIVFQLPSGLTIYNSMFQNADGGRGVIGRPHEVFTQIDSHFNVSESHLLTFLCNQRELYRNGYHVDLDVSLLGYTPSWNITQDVTEYKVIGDVYMSKGEKTFNAIENLGSEITYRCVRCRSCKSCRDCDQTEVLAAKRILKKT